MKTFFKKRFTAVLMALIMVFSSSIVCMAADPEVPEDEIVVSENTLTGVMSGTTTGYVNGSFTVPSDLSGQQVKLFWLMRNYSSANMNAIFKMEIKNSSNVVVATLYLPASESASSHVVGNLLAGTYYFYVTPYTNVSGIYFYAIQFYTF